MPITAKLSRQFYEKLGDDVANELVEWFNSVDATYRLELRELNELNFARFDAKLEQRLAQVEGRLRVEISESKASVIRWMLGFWVAQVAVTISAIVAARQLLR